MKRKPRPVTCRRCKRRFPANSEVGRHVRDGGYCVECKARTAKAKTFYDVDPAEPTVYCLGPDEEARRAEVFAEACRDRRAVYLVTATFP